MTTSNEAGPKLEALYASEAEARMDLIDATTHLAAVKIYHADDGEMVEAACTNSADACWRYVYTAILCQAEEIRTGEIKYNPGIETTAYRDALRVILAHLEEVTA